MADRINLAEMRAECHTSGGIYAIAKVDLLALIDLAESAHAFHVVATNQANADEMDRSHQRARRALARFDFTPRA